MTILDTACWEVIEKSEWVAIATNGPKGPHLAATWGDYVRALGVQNDVLIIPAGHYQQTEENLKADNRIEVMFASRQVQGAYGAGRGCCIRGTATLATSGVEAGKVKEMFTWARGALIIRVEEVTLQL